MVEEGFSLSFDGQRLVNTRAVSVPGLYPAPVIVFQDDVFVVVDLGVEIGIISSEIPKAI